MEVESIENVEKHGKQEDFRYKQKMQQDQQMTSSILSESSSLTSPVDSGVQLLDSESEMASVMSASGIGCDIDIIPNLENDDSLSKVVTDIATLPESVYEQNSHSDFALASTVHESQKSDNKRERRVMTGSDIANQNVEHYDFSCFSTSVPNYKMLDKKHFECFIENVTSEDKEKHTFGKSLSDEVFEPEKPKQIQVKQMEESDLMNVSLNSYELLDYTAQNSKSELQAVVDDPMHISMSEEVGEGLHTCKTENELQLANCDDQIVYRRQRKKKSKSDTPKKRVSFHEDILNSTKIDDIHINHGFITHEPDVSFSFFQNGFVRKPDVVKGRYSWAAEGDAPYYQKNVSERQIKSDIYIHHGRFSSSSSSSSASGSSSIDEEDNSEENFMLAQPINSDKQPKSSCLKKTKRSKKHIDTNIVEEANLKKKETGLLDTNIFGSLKNILKLSTSVPLAERGVPEGQEDVPVYASSHEVVRSRHSSISESTFDVTPAPVKKIDNLNLELAKTNLKLTMSEGFYPNYPNQNLPSNIVLCDSNVYEHKGISYSYEYDKFQKSFEQPNKPKSSTVYQMILKEFNFFKRKAKEPKTEADEATVNTNLIGPDGKSETSSEADPKTPQQNINKYASTLKLDWSDNDTVSDQVENPNSRHLNSPKRKINKSNHYSIQPFKAESLPDFDSSKAFQGLKSASSKSSLINRFLRNVTLKKMLDMKAQKKNEFARKYFSLYVKKGNLDVEEEKRTVRSIEEEVVRGRASKESLQKRFDGNLSFKFRNEVFRNAKENLFNMFSVRSSYTTSGTSRSLLMILSDSTLYIAGLKSNNVYSNHFVLPYADLNTILIGPNSHTIHFSNYGNDMQCLVTTGCGNVTGEIVGQIEIAMRKHPDRPKLPAVKQLSMHDMVNLRRAVCKLTSVDKEEEYFYYGVVNVQDCNLDGIDTPLGPNKEGPLMFKICDSETRWETAYFILKAGVLYMLSSPSYRVPMKVLPLINGACQGARRIYHYPRPHTFQIVVEGTVLYLAAPDEYVASEWLQALVHAASGTYSHEKILARSCSLMITSDHILTVREALPCTVSSLITSEDNHQPLAGPQVLSCASISDITAFRLPSAEHSWCVLEFSCREVHECSGDWILYFSSNAELEKFISALELLWGYHNEQDDCFPLSTIPETDPLNRKCMEVYSNFQKSCLPLTLHYF